MRIESTDLITSLLQSQSGTSMEWNGLFPGFIIWHGSHSAIDCRDPGFIWMITT